MSTSNIMFIYFLALNCAWVCATLVIMALAAREEEQRQVKARSQWVSSNGSKIIFFEEEDQGSLN